MNNQKIPKLSIACYMLFILMCVFIILLKQQLHTDELFSYGSANHIGSIHIEIEDGRTYIPSDVPYLDYMAADQNDRFNYANVWENQALDVHPPLYYAILHTVCSLFPGTFSFWYAGAVNIMFGVLTLYVLRKLLRLFCGNDAPVNLLSVTYIASAGIMTSISFFRMYVMAMFFVTLIAYCFADAVGKMPSTRFYGTIIVVSILAALTHYYCILYLVLTCFLFGICLLFHKKFKEFGLFACSMGGAGILSVVIFPSIITHVFSGYRGTESIDKLMISSIEDSIYRLREFWNFISIELFGGLLPLLFVSAVPACLLAIQKKNSVSIFRWAILTIPAALYFLLVSKTAAYVADRYLFPVYAVVICIFVSMIFLVCRKLAAHRKITADIPVVNLIILALNGLILLTSWGRTTWNYIYRSEAARLEALEEYSETDCIVLYDHRWKTETAFLEISHYNSVTFFWFADLSLMDTFKPETNDLIVLVIGDRDLALQQVSRCFPGLNRHKELGSYAYSTTYYFYHED